MPSLTETIEPVITETIALDGIANSELDLSSVPDGELFQVSFHGDNAVALVLAHDAGRTLYEPLPIGAATDFGTYEKGKTHLRYLYAASATSVTVTIYRVDMGDS